jgi:hypothetical protein
MYSEAAIEAILKLSPDARFVVVVRDPVDAVKSMFSQRLKYTLPRMREISDDFKTCWETLALRKEGQGYPQGCRNRFVFRYDLLYAYERYLPKLFERVAAEHIHIIFYEDLKSSPEEVYRRLFRFLQVDETCHVENRMVNPSYRLEQTSFLKVLAVFADRTAGMRKRFGLKGKRISLIKRLLPQPKKVAKTDDSGMDEAVRREFGQTYAYLETLRKWAVHA